jgi:hypothetical protein
MWFFVHLLMVQLFILLVNDDTFLNLVMICMYKIKVFMKIESCINIEAFHIQIEQIGED